MTKKNPRIVGRPEIIQILELAKIGATVKEITAVVDRSAHLVYTRLAEFGVAVKPSERDADSIVSALEQNHAVQAVIDARATPVQITNKYLSNSNNHTVSPKGIQYGSYKDTLEDIAIDLLEIIDKIETLSKSE